MTSRWSKLVYDGESFGINNGNVRLFRHKYKRTVATARHCTIITQPSHNHCTTTMHCATTPKPLSGSAQPLYNRKKPLHNHWSITALPQHYHCTTTTILGYFECHNLALCPKSQVVDCIETACEDSSDEWAVIFIVIHTSPLNNVSTCIISLE